MRERLSLSGAMWNWFVVSEMSWEGGVSGCCGLVRCCDKTYSYGVFVEENHGGRFLCVCDCLATVGRRIDLQVFCLLSQTRCTFPHATAGVPRSEYAEAMTWGCLFQVAGAIAGDRGQ